MSEAQQKTEIPKAYDPKASEDKWYAYWLKHDFFKAHADSAKPVFTIVIPPPNVTGALHIGHAYNNSVQDIYTRFKRMQGFETLWTPGTDHAGIATQTVVEKQLAKEGTSRKTLGREAFVNEVWKHKETYRARIVGQLQKMGCSCDWEREWFTMDEKLSEAVKEVFIHFYNKGWIYKGQYIVNWCPYSQSAISDEEVEYKEINGKMYYFRYPVKDSAEHIVIATTRPETMLGDTAVVVNPDDARYKHLIGKKVILPLVGREIPIIADDYVDKEFGTGAMKVTPSHDPNDFVLGKRHQLQFLNIMHADATMNQNVPEKYRGMERFAARKAVVADLESAGLVEKIQDHLNRVGYSQRGNVPIEPLVSEQWFLKMDELAKPALEAVLKGDIRFHPEKWIKTYEHWMTSIRDWCISRQLWWGHRIPAFYAPDGSVAVARNADEALAILKKKNAQLTVSDLRQDEDVLDTWFSSWLVPFSSMGWPYQTKDLEKFYPTSLLVTGPDIIFFWVARMIMAGLEFTGKVPFCQVYFNGIVRDELGRKMSKSLGNGIDPIAVIDKYSADALRFTLVDLSAEGQDINLAERQFELGRNFSNKVWNAFRFLANYQEQLPSAKPQLPPSNAITELADRWILSRYHRAVEGITTGLENYKLHEAMDSVYRFFWADYCDWYLELIKDRMYNATPEIKEKTLSTALYILDGVLRLMHPIVPFVTEEIWQRLMPRTDGESIMIQPWPQCEASYISVEAEKDLEQLRDTITTIRNIRSEMNIAPSKKTDLVLRCVTPQDAALYNANTSALAGLARVEKITAAVGADKPRIAASAVVNGTEVYLPLEGVIDLEVERTRLQKEIDRISGQIGGIEQKLGNEGFVAKAPPQVLEKERAKLDNFRATVEKLRSNLSALQNL
ncbi:MAG TPA: valine--tRNA ligase [bacterium]|nr:valine--tRNA ligase [bacterium]